MKILIVNKFLYPRGGDAISAISTGKLLSSKGHDVVFWGMDHPLNPYYPNRKYFVGNVDFNEKTGFLKKIRNGISILYSFEAKRKMEEVLKNEKPDIVHLNNFAHQISPSILHAIKDYSIPVVMTMHDYKLVCPVYTLISNGKVCERCRFGRYYQCTIHRCSKGSYLKSLLNTIEMYLHHRVLHIYNLIDIFISPSKFLKGKVEEMGFRKKVMHLNNFVDTIKLRPEFNHSSNEIVYFGRLSEEKGLFTLLESVKGTENIFLKIVGEGPLRQVLEEKVRKDGIRNVVFIGHLSGEELWREIGRAMFVVVPSEWYEVFGLTIIEAFALGKPVIGARIGAIPELIKDNERGLLFEAGDMRDLKAKIECLINRPSDILRMGKNCRAFIEGEFNEDKYCNGLLDIYNNAINAIKKGAQS